MPENHEKSEVISDRPTDIANYSRVHATKKMVKNSKFGSGLGLDLLGRVGGQTRTDGSGSG